MRTIFDTQLDLTGELMKLYLLIEKIVVLTILVFACCSTVLMPVMVFTVGYSSYQFWVPAGIAVFTVGFTAVTAPIRRAIMVHEAT